VAELRLELPAVTSVLASTDACDAVERAAGLDACRVGDREVLIVGEADAGAIRRTIRDPDAVVGDVSDGWTRVVLDGAEAAEAFARLSELRLPDSGWIQGEVAGTPAKVHVEPGSISMLVPAHLAAHVEERVRADAAEVLSR
jgi:hypothetical protein